MVWEHVQAKIISKMCQWLLHSMTYLIGLSLKRAGINGNVANGKILLINSY